MSVTLKTYSTHIERTAWPAQSPFLPPQTARAPCAVRPAADAADPSSLSPQRDARLVRSGECLHGSAAVSVANRRYARRPERCEPRQGQCPGIHTPKNCPPGRTTQLLPARRASAPHRWRSAPPFRHRPICVHHPGLGRSVQPRRADRAGLSSRPPPADRPPPRAAGGLARSIAV